MKLQWPAGTVAIGIVVVAGCERASPPPGETKTSSAESGNGAARSKSLSGPPFPNGLLGRELGSLVTIRGIVTTDGRKAESGVFWLDVQSVEGVPAEPGIAIALAPHVVGWGERDQSEGPPKLEIGREFELKGYETGAFVGVPDGADEAVGVARATTGFHFRRHFVVVGGGPLELRPAVPEQR
ncbi:MAG: hypothetical protein HEQ23_07460 [Tepidisphaera sp.]